MKKDTKNYYRYSFSFGIHTNKGDMFLKKYREFYYKSTDIFDDRFNSLNKLDIDNSFGYSIEYMHTRNNLQDRNTLKSRDNFINNHNIYNTK
jgi:hypothetical protein